ncbi:type II secretion system minor pseudopilin GspJ [Sphingomonas jinjuensis]|uniref:type II secretion system minor pseudopilin GspJ n=1 Tax=Sphingomonas jinjuensis TaxID=535907 RepID=UPI0031B56626
MDAERGVDDGARGESGFTLVEVMIALLIFSMLAAGGIAILAFSVRAQAAQSKRLDDIGALARTMAILSADLAQARDRPSRDEGGTMLPAFVGAADGSMRFVRAGWSNLDAAPRPGIQKVAYRLGDKSLERIGYPQVDGAPPLVTAVLLGNVSAVSARYRFRGAWSDRWDGTQGASLPDAVELSLTRADSTAYRIVMLVGSGYVPPPLFGAVPGAPA